MLASYAGSACGGRAARCAYAPPVGDTVATDAIIGARMTSESTAKRKAAFGPIRREPGGGTGKGTVERRLVNSRCATHCSYWTIGGPFPLLLSFRSIS